MSATKPLSYIPIDYDKLPIDYGFYDHPHARHPVAGCQCDYCYEGSGGPAVIVWGVVMVGVWIAAAVIGWHLWHYFL